MTHEQAPLTPRRHVTAWIAAGFYCVLGSAAMTLLAPAVLGPEETGLLCTVSHVAGAVYLLLGLFLLVVGIRRGLANPPEAFVPVRAHTIAIAAMGVVCLLVAIPSGEPPELARFVVTFFTLLGLAAFAVVILRVRRWRLGAQVTGALNIVWIAFVPFGTAMFLWWLASVRRRERSQRSLTSGCS